MAFRRILFWVHLSVGAVIGAVILFMALTGILLAFEPQLVAASERSVRVVQPPSADAPRVSLDTLLATARAAKPKPAPSGITLRADPQASVMVALGREEALFLDPYSGTVLGGHSRLHGTMHTVEDLHRWLGNRDLGRPVTGACCLALLFMTISGLYLWFPRVWRRATFRAQLKFDRRLRGQTRERNWHDVVGFWSAPLLLLTTITGAVMAYPWATNLLYTLTGSPPPPAQAQPAKPGERPPPPEIPAVGLDALAARAVAQAPGWSTLSIRFATKPGGPVSVNIQEPRAWGRSYRLSQLTLNSATAAVEKWEPYAEASAGRRARSWMKPLHTGQAAGIAGQTFALVAPVAVCVLVITGLTLAGRRLVRARRERSGNAIAGISG